VAVQPETQIVDEMVACVTAGLSEPGVRVGSGSPGSRSAVELGTPGANGKPVDPGKNEAPVTELASDSSSPSTVVGLGAVVAGEVAATAVRSGEAIGTLEFDGVAVDEEHPASAKKAARAPTASVAKGAGRRP
jgi:hypothetical protein